MEIKLVFYKSSSKYYDSVCLQCESFDNYSQNKSTNEVILDAQELREKHNKVRKVLEVIKNWSKSEYYIDNCVVTEKEIERLLSIILCEQGCTEQILANEYCYGESGWGCKFLNSISLRRTGYYPYNSDLYWYEFGHFEEDVWVIDKGLILTQLKREIETNHIKLCTCFSQENIEKTINSLPDKIQMGDEECEWEYKYRDAPVGATQTEIIGIQPRRQRNSGYGGFGFSVRLTEEDDKEKQELSKNIPTVTFADVGGIDEVLQQIREVIELPLVMPSIFEHYHIKPHKGILLYGPPGCGKTMIAKAVANEIKAHFIAVNGPEILNKYVGQSEANLRKVFDEAKSKSPSVIYFDEFDSIATTRDADGNPLMASVVNQLLTLMDGVDEASQICVIASTNRVDMIDEAIKRPGRFDYVIEIQRPSPAGCKAIFNIHTKNMPIDPLFNKDSFVSQHLLGSTGAEIAFVVTEAAYNSIRRTVDIDSIFSLHEDVAITDENKILECDFIRAIKSLKESRKRADTAKYRYNL